jgi:hypothetical protein
MINLILTNYNVLHFSTPPSLVSIEYEHIKFNRLHQNCGSSIGRLHLLPNAASSNIVSDRDGVIVCIFDAPASGWRTLFVEKDGVITRYTSGEDAMSSVRILLTSVIIVILP